jgi:hypothetical protein
MRCSKQTPLFALLGLLLPSALTAQPAPGPEILDRIQRQCLEAYTPEMLVELYGSAEIPEEARVDSEAAIDQLINVLEVEKGRFYPFLLEDLTAAFDLWVKPGTRFLDLGSGDGRVVFYAASLGAEATGIEYDPQVFGVSERAREALGDVLKGAQLQLTRDDFFNHSWSGWDVVFYFDLGAFDQHRLRKKIFSELDPGARLIVGHQRVAFPGLELETTFDSLHVYRQAETLADYDPKLKEYSYQSVRDVYALFEDWFNGEVERDEKSLARYAEVLTPGFQIIDPRGGVMHRELALDALRGSYGKWKDQGQGVGEIRIENLTLRFIAESVATVTFEESHEARGKTRKLKTTAVMRLSHGLPNNVEWLHVHQSDLRLVIVRRVGEEEQQP